jgi:hypothetical protein
MHTYKYVHMYTYTQIHTYIYRLYTHIMKVGQDHGDRMGE